MPLAHESMKWFIRITAPWEHIEAKVKEVQGWIDLSGYAIGYHVGVKKGRPHAHLAIEMRKSLQQQSINVRLKKVFGVKGADYSSKVWDGSLKALSYLYHDTTGKVEYFRMELTAEQISEIQTVASVYSTIVKDAKEKAATRIPDHCLAEIEASGELWNERRIFRFIVQGIKAGRWYSPGTFQVMRYVEEILVKQEKDDDTMVEFLVDRYMAAWNR